MTVEEQAGESVRPALVSRRLVLGAGLLATVSAVGLRHAGSVEAAYGGPTRSGAARTAVDARSISWVGTRRRRLALTFDDGPDPAVTPRVLDLLARHGAHATFFVVGSNVMAHPRLAERVVAEGHTLANHTFDHAPLEQLTAREVRDQLVRGRGAIAALDAGPRLVRPPRGYTSPLVAQVCADLGERQVFWSLCLDALPGPDDAERGTRFAGALGAGDIALLHDGGRVRGRWAQTYDRTPTVRALDTLLARLTARGIEVTTLPALLREA